MRKLLKAIALAVVAVAVAAGCASPARLHTDTLRDKQYQKITAAADPQQDPLGNALNHALALPVRFTGNDVMYVIEGDPNCLAKILEKRDDCPALGTLENPHIYRGVNKSPSKVGATDFELSATQLVVRGAQEGTYGETVECAWVTGPDGGQYMAGTGNAIVTVIGKARRSVPIGGTRSVVVTDEGTYWSCSHYDVASPLPKVK